MYLLLAILFQFVRVEFPFVYWAMGSVILNVGAALIGNRFERARVFLIGLAFMDTVVLIVLNWFVLSIGSVFLIPFGGWAGPLCFVVYLVALFTLLRIGDGDPVGDLLLPVKGRWARKLLVWVALAVLVAVIPVFLFLTSPDHWILTTVTRLDVAAAMAAALTLPLYLAPIAQLALKAKAESVKTAPQ